MTLAHGQDPLALPSRGAVQSGAGRSQPVPVAGHGCHGEGHSHTRPGHAHAHAHAHADGGRCRLLSRPSQDGTGGDGDVILIQNFGEEYFFCRHPKAVLVRGKQKQRDEQREQQIYSDYRTVHCDQSAYTSEETVLDITYLRFLVILLSRGRPPDAPPCTAGSGGRSRRGSWHCRGAP